MPVKLQAPPRRGFLLAALLLLTTLGCGQAAPPAAAARDAFEGRVAHVYDGDSFRLRVSGRGEIEVRMADIDAPERYQPHAEEARAALKQLIEGQRVRITSYGEDRYRRTLGRVARLPDGLEVNAEQIRRGHAWVYGRTPRDTALPALEREARTAQRGLWALPREQRVPPWRWRREHAPTKTTTGPTPRPN